MTVDIDKLAAADLREQVARAICLEAGRAGDTERVELQRVEVEWRECLRAADAALSVIEAELRRLRAERDGLREALVQHNDRLRSAQQIAQRNGADTNWKSFRGQCTYTLAEYHELVNEARAALEKPHV